MIHPASPCYYIIALDGTQSKGVMRFFNQPHPLNPPCIFRLGGGMNRVEMDVVDRYPRGLRRPQESQGRRVLIFKEPEQLSGPDKPASCKEGT